MRRHAWFLSLVLFWICSTAAAREPAAVGVAERFKGDIAAIAAGNSTEDRAAAVVKLLDGLRLPHRTEAFNAAGYRGVNILVDLPSKASRKLLLGAHYDRVAEGRGAVDNASGVATVIELLAALQKKPLAKYAVTAALFDHEEQGSVGAAAYLAAHRRRGLPDVFLNFDVFAYGDSLWVMSPSRGTRSGKAIAQAVAAARFPAQIGPEYPPSDARPFQRAGVETLSFSLLEKQEIGQMRRELHGEPLPRPPRVMAIIHTRADTTDKIDPEAAARGIGVVEQAVRQLDQQP